MGTPSYPELHQLIRPVTAEGMWRVYPSKHLNKPLGVGLGYSRFSAPNQEFKILYAAESFKTALREGLIRDRFDGRRYRRIAEHTLRKYASTVIATKQALNLVDLADGGATNHGLPSEIRHTKDYAASQAFALEVHDTMDEVDGFLFRSRLDDRYCIAVFERSIASKLLSPKRFTLAKNPKTRPALKEMRVKTFLWRGLP